MHAFGDLAEAPPLGLKAGAVLDPPLPHFLSGSLSKFFVGGHFGRAIFASKVLSSPAGRATRHDLQLLFAVILRAGKVPKGAPRSQDGQFGHLCVCNFCVRASLAKDTKGTPRTRNKQFVHQCVGKPCVPAKLCKDAKGAPRTRNRQFVHRWVCKFCVPARFCKAAKGAPRTRNGQFGHSCVCKFCVPARFCKRRKRCTAHAKGRIWVPMCMHILRAGKVVQKAQNTHHACKGAICCSNCDSWCSHASTSLALEAYAKAMQTPRVGSSCSLCLQPSPEHRYASAGLFTQGDFTNAFAV